MSGDQFEFFLTEAKAGWLESRIVNDGAHYDLSISCSFSDPLKDLFQSLCALHPSARDSEVYRQLDFEWGGEGWLYLWELNPQSNGDITVSVAFKGKREVGGKEFPMWEFQTTLPWQTLAEQVFTQASEMLWMYGFTGYYERWTKDFPAGRMMQLGHLLHGRDMNTYDFSRELGYLAETR